MSKIHLSLAISLMIVCAIIGSAVGYYLTPEYRLAMYDKNPMTLGTADRWIDQRYLNAMIAHHRGAMLLAEQAKGESNRPEIQELAEKILKDEPVAIAELYTWKKSWYNDTRTVKDPAPIRLGRADASFDLRFLNALIAHHDAGLLMTREIKTKSSRPEVIDNANAVETFLTTTLKILQEWRSEWYNV